MKFPRFWYESNPCWGYVNSLEELKDKMDLQLAEPNSINSVDEFLDMSKQCEATLNFGTRIEHHGKKTLRMFLEEHNLLQDFLKLTENEVQS